MEGQVEGFISTDAQVESDNWSLRLAAYDAWIAEVERSLVNEECLQWRLCKLPVLISQESNVLVLKRALDFLLVGVAKAAVSAPLGESIAKSVVTKIGLKPLYEKIEAVMERFVECGRSDVAIDCLLSGSQNKAPHIASACFEIIASLTKILSVRKLDTVKLLNFAVSGLENRSVVVRKAAKVLLIEIGKRTGPSLLSTLQGVKPIVMNEVLSELASDVNKPDCQQPANALKEGVPSAPSESITVQSAEPVDVLKLLPPSFYDDVKSNSWSVRMNAMEKFLNLLEANPLLDPKASYGCIISELAALLSKERNTGVVNVVAKCMVILARSLKKRLPLLSKILLPALCLRMKDKKSALMPSLSEALDAVMETTSMEASCSLIVEALNSKYVGVKAQTALMLSRYFVHVGSAAFCCAKSSRIILGDLVKLSFESDAAVRHAALTALGAAKAVISGTDIRLFTEAVEPIKNDRTKMSKVLTCADSCKSCVEEPSGLGAAKMETKDDPSDRNDDSNCKSVECKTACITSSGEVALDKMHSQILSENEKLSENSKTATVTVCSSKKRTSKQEQHESTYTAKTKDSFTTRDTFAESQSLLCPLTDTRSRSSLYNSLSQWTHERPSEVMINELRNRMTVVCKRPLFSLLWSEDPEERCLGIDHLMRPDETSKDTFMSCTSLFLKWSCVQLCMDCAALHTRALDLIRNIFEAYIDHDDDLKDCDAEYLLPHMLRLFENESRPIRIQLRELVVFMATVYPYDAMQGLISEAVLRSSNERFISECINVMRALLCINPVDCVVPQVLEFLVPYLKHSGKMVRNVAVNAFISIYATTGYDREDLQHCIAMVPDILDKLGAYEAMNLLEAVRFDDLHDDWPFKDSYPRFD
uniref:TOG domain-containing protein n=1 Tax=Trichuris muris TaxID=70415 RepID=A0A5S6QJH5_TRIMR